MLYVLTPTRVESYEKRTAAEARQQEVAGSVVASKPEDLLEMDQKLLVSEDDTTMATKTKKAKGTSKKASGTPGAGRPSKLAGKTLTKLVETKDYPRREGSKAFKGCWGVLRNGMTYEQFIKAGGVRKHLAWDIANKYVKAS